MFDLSSKSVLLTGATGGIGQETARALHARGARVAISGTRKEILDALAAELGDRALPLPCDLGDPSSVAELANEAVREMGTVDILINNAGITMDGLLLRMSDDQWQRVLDVNLTSAMRLSRSCLRGMLKKRWGRIINITSVVGESGNPGQSNYAASKAGLAGFSRALAREVAARGITVNCIAPGYVATKMTEALTDRQKAQIQASIPVRRIGHPTEIAAAAVYIASDEAAYMTGHTLQVNGGLLMA